MCAARCDPGMDSKGKGSLLLMLVSNLLLCGNVASRSLCPKGADCQESLLGLFDEMITKSLKMQRVSIQIFLEIYTLHSKDPFYFFETMDQCPTASIQTPLSKLETLNLQHEDLIKMVICLTGSWEKPLNYLVSEALRLPSIRDSLIHDALNIELEITRLLIGLKEIARRVVPELKDIGDYAVWSVPTFLRSADEEPRLYALRTVFRCLYRDIDKITTFLSFLKCQVMYNGRC